MIVISLIMIMSPKGWLSYIESKSTHNLHHYKSQVIIDCLLPVSKQAIQDLSIAQNSPQKYVSPSLPLQSLYVSLCVYEGRREIPDLFSLAN